MSFEETLSLVFQPGMFEMWALAMSCALLSQFAGCLLICFMELVFSLIRRFVWPGKKVCVTQSQDPGAGAAG